VNDNVKDIWEDSFMINVAVIGTGWCGGIRAQLLPHLVFFFPAYS
jgi:hypothetical protein